MVTAGPAGPRDVLLLLAMDVGFERDVFALRRQAKICAEAAGLEGRDQVRLATALSELGRDLLRPQPLSAAFRLRGRDPSTLVVVLEWRDGRKIGDESLAAVTRLFPQVRQESGDRGGRVVIECALPASLVAVTERAERIRSVLRAETDDGVTVIDDLRAQTRDLLAALDESRAQREELRRLNAELSETNQGVVALYTELSQELEETNRGVVALYAELDEKSRLLREASESKTRFWSNVSHELRTPVNSVIGLSRLLLDPGSDPLTPEQRRQAVLIGAAGNMLLTLVDELLDVAKAEAGQLVPQIAPVDLPLLLAQIHGLMAGAKPSADVELAVGDGSGLPALWTDEVMLTRILRNLLSNGLKFTRGGEVRLDVSAQDGDWLLFTVRDTGVGIPEDQQALIFEEFYQVPGPHQRDRPGTGLGLPYARRLAGLLGGALTLTSAPGEGTTVTLRLPVRLDERSAPIRRLGTVLAADDDPAFAEVFRPILEQIAQRVLQVGSGAEVLEAVRRERPDAVLLDLQMPGTDGYAVLAAMAAEPQLRDIPVVVVTGAELPEQASRLGHARGVVSKHRVTPARLSDLLSSGPGEVGER